MNDSYYLSLAVLDRINDEINTKFGNPYTFAKYFGKSKPYWTNILHSRYSIQVDTFIRLAEALGTSVEYLLTGKNKQTYKPVKVCYDNLIARYQDYIRNKRYDYDSNIFKNLQQLVSVIKKGKCNITLTTLFKFEDMLRAPAYQLAFEELNMPAIA